MKKTPLFEITVTGTEHGEWQGRVRFSANGEEYRFCSLTELLKLVEKMEKRKERQ